MSSIVSYRPRYFVFDDVWNVEGVALKAYLISRNADQAVSNELRNSSHEYVVQAFPAAYKQEGHAHGLGYIILHAGEMNNWLLIHWWAHQDIALRLLASSDPGRTQFNSQDHRRFHACVWEHEVIDHERDAWVRNMMCDRQSPQKYLTDRLIDGYY